MEADSVNRGIVIIYILADSLTQGDLQYTKNTFQELQYQLREIFKILEGLLVNVMLSTRSMSNHVKVRIIFF